MVRFRELKYLVRFNNLKSLFKFRELKYSVSPKINIFWHKVYSELVTIFGTDMTFNRDKLLFGFVHSANVSVKNKYLFGILSLAARKAITRKWLKPDVPSIDEWYDIIYDVFVMERITFSMRLQQSKFNDIWKQWKMHISLKRPSFV